MLYITQNYSTKYLNSLTWKQWYALYRLEADGTFTRRFATKLFRFDTPKGAMEFTGSTINYSYLGMLDALKYPGNTHLSTEAKSLIFGFNAYQAVFNWPWEFRQQGHDVRQIIQGRRWAEFGHLFFNKF
jgi:hypothetical protein